MPASFGANQNNNQLVDALLNALTQPQNKKIASPMSQGFANSGRENPIQDLRPIIAQASMQQPMPSMIPPAMPIAEPTMPQISTNTEPQLDEYGQTKFGRFLSTMGIPLASTLAGLAIPGALPAASGFSQGYVPQMLDERKSFRDNKIVGKKQDLEERKLRIAESKAEQQEESLRQNSEMMRSILKGGGDYPVGTVARVGNLTIPVNRKLDEVERGTLADAPRVSESIDNIIGLLDSGASKGQLKRALISSGNPLFVSGTDESLQSSLNDLKSVVPFMRGGKSLTDNEKESQYALLNVFGKDDVTIKKDLNRFKDNMSALESLVLRGEQLSSQGMPLTDAQFKAAKAQILKGSPVIDPMSGNSYGTQRRVQTIGRFQVETE